MRADLAGRLGNVKYVSLCLVFFLSFAPSLFSSCGLVHAKSHPLEQLQQSQQLQGAHIPRAALAYRALLVRTARMVFGMQAPVASLAAQVHQESWWRNNARSFAGAEGLAQFMPKTATWLAEIRPELGEPLPYNPAWALRAMCLFDKWLFIRTKARVIDDDCERAAFTLSAYNGGETWVRRDQALAQKQGQYDSKRYFGHSERGNAGRSAAAWRENRLYVRRILGRWENMYEGAGWGFGMCEGISETVQKMP